MGNLFFKDDKTLKMLNKILPYKKNPFYIGNIVNSYERSCVLKWFLQSVSKIKWRKRERGKEN